ncbi:MULTISPECIES: hypothetical protein [unclassified Endozoicomonas]|uniref:hypothetical protein n=1 Tax=unclassified Endozoicomonas TaxID=2644528 RepID=UPI003BB0E6A2
MAERKEEALSAVEDPIGMAEHTFVINFSPDEISPNPALPAKQKALARKTITRLKLDSHQNDKMVDDSIGGIDIGRSLNGTNMNDSLDSDMHGSLSSSFDGSFGSSYDDSFSSGGGINNDW